MARTSLFLLAATVISAMLLRNDPGILGLGEMLSMIHECVSGESPWCDSSIIGALVWSSIAAVGDKFTETAEQVAMTHAPGEGALKGKVAIVTGSSAGIGVETARVLMSKGFHVIFAVRSVAKGEAVLQRLVTEGTSGKGTVLELNLADLKSVNRFAKTFASLELPLHLLINNAGIMMLPERQTSSQGHEMQFAVNHLGGFQLTRLLEDKLLASGSLNDPARVIYLSSEASQGWAGPGVGGSMAKQVPPEGRKYHPFHIYSLTKALNILTAKEQQRRWGVDKSAIAVAVHPGVIKTELLSNAGPIEAAFFGWPFAYAHKTVAQGASTTIYAALARQVVTEARAGIYYYVNNGASSPQRAEYFEEKVAADAWDRSEKIIGPL